MNINPATFFDKYHAAFGKLNQSQVDGLNSLIAHLNADPHVTDPRWAAYMLATVRHETAVTYQPIAEYGKGKGRRYGKPDANGHTYYGRGYVQLTWKANYDAMSRVLHVDLVNHPDDAMLPENAYWILSYGMRHGSFTGKKLSDYIDATWCDYLEARRIINGVDKAQTIAGYAVKFQDCLK